MNNTKQKSALFRERIFVLVGEGGFEPPQHLKSDFMILFYTQNLEFRYAHHQKLLTSVCILFLIPHSMYKNHVVLLSIHYSQRIHLASNPKERPNFLHKNHGTRIFL